MVPPAWAAIKSPSPSFPKNFHRLRMRASSRPRQFNICLAPKKSSQKRSRPGRLRNGQKIMTLASESVTRKRESWLCRGVSEADAAKEHPVQILFAPWSASRPKD